MDETAKKMNEALKSAGFNRRKVSVKHRRCLYDDAYDVTIHDPDVSKMEIEEICNQFEYIRRDEYCGEILAGCNNYVSVERNCSSTPDTSRIEPMIEAALRAKLQTGENQTVQLPSGRKYLIGQQQGGNPDLWGPKADYFNRGTGEHRYPDCGFDYLCDFYRPLNDESIVRCAREISLAIAENELDINYIKRAAKNKAA